MLVYQMVNPIQNPMVFLWFSYGFSCLPMVFPKNRIKPQSKSMEHHFPMVFPWFSYAFPGLLTGPPWFSYVFTPGPPASSLAKRRTWLLPRCRRRSTSGAKRQRVGAKISHRLLVWNIYLYLVHFWGKCRYIFHTWSLWV